MANEFVVSIMSYFSLYIKLQKNVWTLTKVYNISTAVMLSFWFQSDRTTLLNVC